MTTAVWKKGETTRIRVRLESTVAPVGPLNLGGKTLKVKVDNGADGLALASALEAQTGATLGWFWFEGTAANITALNNPEQVIVSATLWNADATIFADIDPMTIAVEL